MSSVACAEGRRCSWGRPGVITPARVLRPHRPNMDAVRFDQCAGVVVRASATRDPRKRIVITGIGLASVFGNDPDVFYNK